MNCLLLKSRGSVKSQSLFMTLRWIELRRIAKRNTTATGKEPQASIEIENQATPVYMVNMGSGMYRGGVCSTTTTKATTSRNMATLCLHVHQLTGQLKRAALVFTVYRRYWISMLWPCCVKLTPLKEGISWPVSRDLGLWFRSLMEVTGFLNLTFDQVLVYIETQA